MEKVEVVMITAPLIDHFPPYLDLAKLMLQRSHQLSITFLMMKIPSDPENEAKIQSVINACSLERLHFHDLPPPEEDSSQSSNPRRGSFIQLIGHYKDHVREALSRIEGLSGIIVDMMNTAMIDVADDVGVPSYMLFSSGAAFLGLLFHFQTLEDKHNQLVSDLLSTETELDIPSFVKRVPTSVLPVFITRKELWSSMFLKCTRDYRRAKGIIVNTFTELETHAINSLSTNSSYGESGLPAIYPVAPIINKSQVQSQSRKEHSEIMNWLDAQPQNSVVFLCFGSMGSFHSDQVKEIAHGLEKSGYRFLWVLRQPPAKKGEFAGDFEKYDLALPEGFLGRTASVGKVVGWAPQWDVLSHQAVGGFVTHCGWNTVLESIWCGVPMATWPLHAEQQLNAFELVKELGIAVEICLDYFEAKQDQAMVRAEQVQKGIRELMDGEHKVRERLKEFSEKSRLAVEEGGSSYSSLGKIVENFTKKLPGTS